MNLVVGATGMVGSEVCRLLAASGRPVRALARDGSDAAKVAALERMGATVVRGDLRDAQSLRTACRDVTHVICTASSMPFSYAAGQNTPDSTDRDGAIALVQAARDAGVRQFVYVSVPLSPIPFPLGDAKRAVEARLVQSGMAYTILRPTFFMEAWLSPLVGFDYANRTTTIYGDGNNAISWISFRDVAQAAVASLDNGKALNAVLDLGGPEALSPREAVNVFERVVGQPFETTHVPVAALEAQMAAAADPMQKSFAALMLGYAYATATDGTAAQHALSLKPATLESYARAIVPADVVASL